MRELVAIALAVPACISTQEPNCTPGTCQNWVHLAAPLTEPPAALSQATITLCVDGLCSMATLPTINSDLVNLDNFLPHWDVQVSLTTGGGTLVTFGCPDCSLSLANGDTYAVTIRSGTQVLFDRSASTTYTDRASCNSEVVCKVSVFDL